MDVCPVDGSQSGGDEIWSDDVRVDMKVEIQLVGEDGWELAEKLEVVECPMVEGDWWCALGSSPQRPSFIVDSTVCFICCIISSGLKDTLEPGCVDVGATGVGGSDAWDVE